MQCRRFCERSHSVFNWDSFSSEGGDKVGAADYVRAGEASSLNCDRSLSVLRRAALPSPYLDAHGTLTLLLTPHKLGL